jgi:5-methylcytosine-specific restriction protein A
MKKTICNYPGCAELIEPNETYCDIHKKEKKETISTPFKSAVRFNGLLYNTARWRKLRREILNKHPYCSECGIGKNETILEVHHIIAPRGNEDLFFDETNLVSVCPVCHKRITNKEIRGRKK